MSTPIDLTQLPAPSVVEVLDFEAILAGRKADLVSLLPEAKHAAVTALLELESEPATKLLEENAYQETGNHPAQPPQRGGQGRYAGVCPRWRPRSTGC